MNNQENLCPEELIKMDKCPCEICKDPEQKELINKLDEVCDIYANEMIDYLIEKSRKDLLKQVNKEDKLKK